MKRIILCSGFLLVSTVSTWAAPPEKGSPGGTEQADPKPPVENRLSRALAERIDFTVAVTPQQARPGETVKLTITGKPKSGYHTYPITQRTPEQPASQLSRIDYEETAGLRPLRPVTESPPEFKKGDDNQVYLEHDKTFTWSQDVLVLPSAAPGLKSLPVTIRLAVCDAKGCFGPGPYPPLKAVINVTDEKAVPLTPELEERLRAKPPEVKVVPLPAERTGPAAAPAPKAASPKTENRDLLTLILSGMLGGLLSLLTPCVLPMVPITVSFFLKQAERAHHRPLTIATVYSLTIVVVLTAGGYLLMDFIRRFIEHWATNFLLGALFVFFALSLFGMYEIQLPSALARFTSAREGRSGLVGTFFMALTFTIVSFACVGPIYASFLTLAASAQSVTDQIKPVLGTLAFAVTFAAPFFVLALFPTLLRKLPKGGSWMNTLKVVMGFLVFAAAFKFLSAGELLLRSGKLVFLTYDLVLGLYVALSLLCALYLLGIYRLPHDEPSEHLGVPRLLCSLLFLGLSFYLLPGLFKDETGAKQRPAGEVFAWLTAILPPIIEEEAGPSGPDGGKSSTKLSWIGNLQQGLEQAQNQQQLVFIDFTGFS